MKLLFDQNLSPRLVDRLAEIYPGSIHVSMIGLERAVDHFVWQYAGDNGFTIVSKDADFSELAVIHGFPPKVIWLRLGNCTTGQIEGLLRAHLATVNALASDENTGTLVLL